MIPLKEFKTKKNTFGEFEDRSFAFLFSLFSSLFKIQQLRSFLPEQNINTSSPNSVTQMAFLENKKATAKHLAALKNRPNHYLTGHHNTENVIFMECRCSSACYY